MSKFYEGQKVVCVSDNFPIISTTDADKTIIGTHPKNHPQIGETLVIDEMLGDEWLRFDKYDNESFNWWNYLKFRPWDEIERFREAKKYSNYSVRYNIKSVI